MRSRQTDTSISPVARWGFTVPGGRQNFRGTPIFYQAAFQQQGTGQAPTIHSEYHSLSFEINDTIKWKDWSFNVGVLASRDTLYGQGLREAPGTLTGFTTAPGSKYKMYEIDFEDMILRMLAKEPDERQGS